MNKIHHTYFYVHIFFFWPRFLALTLRVRNIWTPIRLRNVRRDLRWRTLLWYCGVASYFCVMLNIFSLYSRFYLQIRKVITLLASIILKVGKSSSLEHLLCFLSFHRHKIVRRYDGNSNLLCLCFNQSAVGSTELCSDWLRNK